MSCCKRPLYQSVLHTLKFQDSEDSECFYIIAEFHMNSPIWENRKTFSFLLVALILVLFVSVNILWLIYFRLV